MPMFVLASWVSMLILVTLHAHHSVPQELVGICKWGLTLRPAASPEQLRCALDLMRCWARLKLQQLQPEETAIMFSLFDDTLVQVLSWEMHIQLIACNTII